MLSVHNFKGESYVVLIFVPIYSHFLEIMHVLLFNLHEFGRRRVAAVCEDGLQLPSPTLDLNCNFVPNLFYFI